MNNISDNYKFRTGFSAHYKTEDGYSITTQVILKDGFYLESDGYSIVTNKSNIIEALNNMGLSPKNKELALKYLEKNSDKSEASDDYWFIDEPDFIEQSTGLSDKNDNLIYDGDILKSKYSDIMKYVVYRGENGFRYKAYGAGNQYCDDGILSSNTSVFEIIGNIHDNSELLDEEKLRIFHSVTRDDIGKICAFYTNKPSEVTYDILADIEGQQYSEEYIGQSGIISRNCRRLNKMESQFECLKQKNG